MYQTNEITIGLKFEWEGSGGGDFISQVPFITIKSSIWHIQLNQPTKIV